MQLNKGHFCELWSTAAQVHLHSHKLWLNTHSIFCFLWQLLWRISQGVAEKPFYPWPIQKGVSDRGDPLRQSLLFLLSLRCLRRTDGFGSPVRLGSLSTSLVRLSGVSTLAVCQQRSAWVARLWKHNPVHASLRCSNGEEHYRERRVCLTCVWSFHR